MRHGIHLSKEMYLKTLDDKERIASIPYASAIDNLMYAMLCARLDIAYVVNVISRFWFNPGLEHLTTVKAIFKYLRRIKDLILTYGSFMLIYNGGAVIWKSCKQTTTMDSTTEVKYVVVSNAIKKVVWINKFVSELNIVSFTQSPIALYCDNNRAIIQ